MLVLFIFDDEEGKECYWYSSAYVLGEALELEYGVDLIIGLVIEEGFYYDCYLGECMLMLEDMEIIKGCMEKIIKEK